MQEFTIDNLGCKIHYWMNNGDHQEWLFFLHGAGLDHHTYELQLAALPNHYNVVLCDLRGHGKSVLPEGTAFDYHDALQDIVLICEKHQIKSATFIGQSMGGNLAQDIAYYHPQLVKSLILIDCLKNTNKLTPLEKLTLKMMPMVLMRYPEPVFLKLSARLCGKQPNTRKYAEQTMAHLGKAKIITVLSALKDAFHADVHYRSHCPILLICGKYEKIIKIKKVMTQWPSQDVAAKLVWIDDAAHCSNQDNALAVNQAINQHLATL